MELRIQRSLVSIVLVLIISQQTVRGQENAQTRIPNSLAECYENPEIYERDNRLPATINTLIELIRKVEDSNEYNRDIKDIAITLLHRFRMDGIEHAKGNFRGSVLPFSPSGYQFSKHRLLLSRLIPGNANGFPNDTLTAVERCTLHFLMSSSIETQVRGDESVRCGQLAQFRSARFFLPNEFGRKKRSAYVPRNNYICDIEMMSDLNDPKQCQRYTRKPRVRQYKAKTTIPPVHPYENDDYGGFGEPEDGEDIDEGVADDENYPYDQNVGRGLIDVASNAVSQCPVENGVIRTVWGAVAAGPLIAGIAAGLVQQNVATLELLKLTRNYNMMPRRQQLQQGQPGQPYPPGQPGQPNGNGRNNGWGNGNGNGNGNGWGNGNGNGNGNGWGNGNGNGNGNRPPMQLNVDNRWAATLSGDLAEVTLLQGPMLREISVGAAGAWNSTTVPHWYFLSQRERLEMTDAEIRGGIDGLVLGLNIADWRRDMSQLRLSQILDMYYSNHGILSSKFRSCNRRELFKEFAQPNQMQVQTMAFSTVLDREMQLQVTLTNRNIEQFSTSSADTLINYVSNGLNDVTCDATSAMSSETRTAADLHIFVETTWQFNEIQPAIATLLDNLDVNRFGSQVTIYNANDASVMVNTTQSVADVFMLWNVTSHTMKPSGLNLAAIVKKIREIGAAILDEERVKSQAGGRSFISLVVPQLTGISEGDSNYVAEQLYWIREKNPDLTLLFWAGGSPGRFSRFVNDQQRDLFQLMAFSSSGSDSSQQTNSYTLPVIKRIQSGTYSEVPRRIGYPRCNSDWQNSDWGATSIDQFVDSSSINFYRLAPNYFFRSNGVVRIQSRYQAQIIVCSSRWVEQPSYNNSTTQQDNVDCRQLQNTESYDFWASNACEGYNLIHDCPPVFFSVQTAPSAAQNYFQCNELFCRYPNDVKYTITTDNLDCFSGTIKIMCQSSILVFSLGLIICQKICLLF